MTGRDHVLATICAIGAMSASLAAGQPARAQVAAPVGSRPVAPDEAWWTGPIAASSADTLPRGHVLIEPYLYDVRLPGGDYLGSLTFILYGLTDRLTVGAIPTFGSARSRGSASRRRVAVNDLTLQAQFRLHRATVGELVPTLAVLLQRGVAIGRYDRLGADPDIGIGSGIAPTTLGINAQRIDRLPSGRALRTRVNLARSLPSNGQVRDASIFGTPTGFVGSARVGPITTADLSVEYSVTRRFALAADVIARWTGPVATTGRVAAAGSQSGFASVIPAGQSFSVAPAVEYSWTGSRGVLLGVRWTAAGRGHAASVTPVIAFNMVL